MKRWLYGAVACGLAAGWVAMAADDAKEAERKAPPVLMPVFAGTNAAGGTNAAAAVPTNAMAIAQKYEDFMRMVREDQARQEAIKKQMAERIKELKSSNPELKAAADQMTAMQRQINAVLAADAELAELKLQHDMLWTVLPSMPGPRAGRAMPPGMMMPRQ